MRAPTGGLPLVERRENPGREGIGGGDIRGGKTETLWLAVDLAGGVHQPELRLGRDVEAGPVPGRSAGSESGHVGVDQARIPAA